MRDRSVLLFWARILFLALLTSGSVLGARAKTVVSSALCEHLNVALRAPAAGLSSSEIDGVLRRQQCMLGVRRENTTAQSGGTDAHKKKSGEKVRDTSKAELLRPLPTFAINFAEPDVRSVFVARDSLNVLGSFAEPQRDHGITLPAPLGASVSGTIDQLKSTRSLSVVGYFGLCVVCYNAIGGNVTYSIGPAVIADGSLTDPFVTTSITPSALRVGPDIQFIYHDAFRIAGQAVSFNFDALPFYQTDFRGLARMSGLQLLAEPTNEALRLNSAKCPEPETGHCAFGFSWRVVPELNLVDVNHIGQTFYTQTRTYGWVGGNVQASAFFCQGSDPWCGKLPAAAQQFLSSLLPTVQYRYLTDAGGSGQTVSYFLASVQYLIGAGKGSENGAASIQLSYQIGKDELTLQESRQAKLALSFKY